MQPPCSRLVKTAYMVKKPESGGGVTPHKDLNDGQPENTKSWRPINSKNNQ